MSEWWTYRPSDFLMFSPRTYHRLFELWNVQVWPLQVVLLLLGAAAIAAVWRGRSPAIVVALGVLGGLWVAVGLGYHAGHLASVHTAAPWYAAAFVAEGIVLVAWAALLWRESPSASPPMPRRATVVGTALLLVAVVLIPLAAPMLGRPWTQAEVAGIAPDPTVVATFALLAAAPASQRQRLPLRLLPWIVPLAWTVVGATTLAVMDAPEALLMPMAAALALFARWRMRSLRGR